MDKTTKFLHNLPSRGRGEAQTVKKKLNDFPQVYEGKGFPYGLDGKESTCNAGDPGLIPGLERSLGEGNGYPPQYSCLENSMDRGVWRVTDHGVTRSQTQSD